MHEPLYFYNPTVKEIADALGRHGLMEGPTDFIQHAWEAMQSWMNGEITTSQLPRKTYISISWRWTNGIVYAVIQSKMCV